MQLTEECREQRTTKARQMPKRTEETWEVGAELPGTELRKLKLHAVALSYFSVCHTAMALPEAKAVTASSGATRWNDLRKAGWGMVGSTPRKQELSTQGQWVSFPGRKAVGSALRA